MHVYDGAGPEVASTIETVLPASSDGVEDPDTVVLSLTLAELNMFLDDNLRTQLVTGGYWNPWAVLMAAMYIVVAKAMTWEQVIAAVRQSFHLHHNPAIYCFDEPFMHYKSAATGLSSRCPVWKRPRNTRHIATPR